MTSTAPPGLSELRVLVVDDEADIRLGLTRLAASVGAQVEAAENGQAALEILERWPADVVLTDLMMPKMSGAELLVEVKRRSPDTEVVILTGFGTVQSAVQCLQSGAAHFLTKPFDNDDVVQLVERLGRQVLARRSSLDCEGVTLLAEDVRMQPVVELIARVATSPVSVLIEGESGTGKECVARALHEASLRAEGPFVALSCAALPETLLEGELFGHEKGAFTDARKDKRGRFELADGGTFFLDDIDDMPLAVQVKLLRVLQERSFERLGGETTREVDIRVVAATKVPLRAAVAAGRFREDLFYRINVVPITLPRLRDRDGDVPRLTAHMIERHGGGRSYDFARSTLSICERYPWPGNVRELENAVQRAIALAGSETELAVENLVPLDTRWRGAVEPAREVAPLREVLRAAEIEHIGRALEATGGHRSQTADRLGISRKVLWEKMRDHDISAPGDEDGSKSTGA